MKTVGIIAEYNPFHNGHLYHVQSIRREFGEDTAIIAVMSGNYTQRGEPACFDKVHRAACAVESGVDLVLELPFPFCSAPAEIFARSAVCILNSLGCMDVLSFGSECGDIDAIRTVSERLSSDDFSKAREAAVLLNPELGHAYITEKVYRELYRDDITFSPNNILAFEYLSALRLFQSTALPHTVQRIGAGYASEELASDFSSASAIRRALGTGNDAALSQLPPHVRKTVEELMVAGQLPSDMERLYPAVAQKLLTNDPSGADIPDALDGLYFRLCASALQASNFSSFIERTQTKRYTRSRIRRVILYTLFGVTSSDLREFPLYTQLLGATPVGLSILKQIKDQTAFPILTKPSDAQKLPEGAKRQKALSDAADRLFCLSLPQPMAPYRALTYTPHIKR